MMWLYLISVVLVGVLGSPSGEKVTGREAYTPSLSMIIWGYHKCVEAGGNQLLYDIVKSLEDGAKCIQGRAHNATWEAICTNFADECIDPFFNTVKRCLKPEEVYLPVSLKNVFLNSTSYLCEYKEEKLDEIFDIKGKQCFDLVLAGSDYNTCAENFYQYLSTKTEKNAVTKSELCSELDTLRDCATKSFHTECAKHTDLLTILKTLSSIINIECIRE